jgi:hypothetical protein
MGERIVTIFGTGKAKSGDSAYQLAYETGRLLAEAGFSIANGGYGGTMEASARGASQAGGQTIGVTCSAFTAKANKYISREVTTDSLQQRLDTLIESGQAYVVLPGGTGTLLELAKVWELENKGFLKKNRPIILVGEFWKPLVDLIRTLEPGSSSLIQLADGPERIKEFLVNIDG